MIVTALLGIVFSIINFILSLIGNIISFPEGFLDAVLYYINLIVTNGAGLLFFFGRYSTVMVALDVLFFLWTAVPLYHFIMWILRKVPFINVQ